MTEVLQSSPSHFSSASSSSSTSCAANDSMHPHALINNSCTNRAQESDVQDQGQDQEDIGDRERKEREREGDQLSLLAVLIAAFRRSLTGCSISSTRELCSMEIGLPTNVRHVAHVTFDRFNGFLGLPVEFEPEVPRRAPSARNHGHFCLWTLELGNILCSVTSAVKIWKRIFFSNVHSCSFNTFLCQFKEIINTKTNRHK